MVQGQRDATKYDPRLEGSNTWRSAIGIPEHVCSFSARATPAKLSETDSRTDADGGADGRAGGQADLLGGDKASSDIRPPTRMATHLTRDKFSLVLAVSSPPKSPSRFPPAPSRAEYRCCSKVAQLVTRGGLVRPESVHFTHDARPDRGREGGSLSTHVTSLTLRMRTHPPPSLHPNTLISPTLAKERGGRRTK